MNPLYFIPSIVVPLIITFICNPYGLFRPNALGLTKKDAVPNIEGAAYDTTVTVIEAIYYTAINPYTQKETSDIPTGENEDFSLATVNQVKEEKALLKIDRLSSTNFWHYKGLFAIGIALTILLILHYCYMRSLKMKDVSKYLDQISDGSSETEHEDVFHSYDEFQGRGITEQKDNDPILEQLFASLSEDEQQMTMMNQGLETDLEDIMSINENLTDDSKASYEGLKLHINDILSISEDGEIDFEDLQALFQSSDNGKDSPVLIEGLSDDLIARLQSNLKQDRQAEQIDDSAPVNPTECDEIVSDQENENQANSEDSELSSIDINYQYELNSDQSLVDDNDDNDPYVYYRFFQSLPTIEEVTEDEEN